MTEGATIEDIFAELHILTDRLRKIEGTQSRRILLRRFRELLDQAERMLRKDTLSLEATSHDFPDDLETGVRELTDSI